MAQSPENKTRLKWDTAYLANQTCDGIKYDKFTYCWIKENEAMKSRACLEQVKYTVSVKVFDSIYRTA